MRLVQIRFLTGRNLDVKRAEEGKVSLDVGQGFIRAVKRPSNDGFSLIWAAKPAQIMPSGAKALRILGGSCTG